MAKEIYCPYCNEVIDLEEDRIGPGLYECPNCGEVFEDKEAEVKVRTH
jgi:uncharacterized Zn finger protein